MFDLFKLVWLSKDETIWIRVYDQLFRLSYDTKNLEAWIDIDPNNESLTVRVSTEKELADVIRKHTAMCPLLDGMILFDVKNAVCKGLRAQDILE